MIPRFLQAMVPFRRQRRLAIPAKLPDTKRYHYYTKALFEVNLFLCRMTQILLFTRRNLRYNNEKSSGGPRLEKPGAAILEVQFFETEAFFAS